MRWSIPKKRRAFAVLLMLGLTFGVAPAYAQVRLEIDGAPDDVADNLRNHIGDIADTEIQHPRQLRRRVRQTLPNATEALGYYNTRFEMTIDGKIVRVKLQLDEPVRWAPPVIAVAGTASTLKTIKSHIASTPLRPGERMNQGVYDTFKRDLLENCLEYGFLDATYRTSELRVDLETHQATATLQLDCGTRYRFSTVTYTETSLDPDLLQRLLAFENGSPYRKRKISDLYRNLQNSGYFGDIDIETVPDRATHLVAVKVAAKDAPSDRFSIGLGYGTDTGPRFRFRWDRPQVNSAGHSFSVETTISDPEQKLTAEYRIPLQRPLDQFINFPTTFERKIVEDTDSTLGKTGVFYNDRYGANWRGSFGANFEVESYQQGSEPRKSVQYLVPGTTFTKLELPEGIDPQSGHKIWLDARGSVPTLGADNAFLRLDAGYKQLFSLGGSSLVVARGEVGTIATGDINQIPSSQRFFTGGDATVRGFDYESLAPKDANDELIGGRYLNVASVDYSIKVLPEWRAAVFMDAGRAFNDTNEDWHKAVGVGVRWLSPVGQIRVDLAFPIDEDEKSWRLHIFMGPPL
jgi:translocation and assembly module TamA